MIFEDHQAAQSSLQQIQMMLNLHFFNPAHSKVQIPEVPESRRSSYGASEPELSTQLNSPSQLFWLNLFNFTTCNNKNQFKTTRRLLKMCQHLLKITSRPNSPRVWKLVLAQRASKMTPFLSLLQIMSLSSSLSQPETSAAQLSGLLLRWRHGWSGHGRPKNNVDRPAFLFHMYMDLCRPKEQLSIGHFLRNATQQR